jgi:hypothetical protein
MLLDRHGRACPGHPRLSCCSTKDVDARDKRGHDDQNHDDLNEQVVQVAPFGIFRMYEAYFPRSRPVLDRFFALNRQTDVVVVLAMHEDLQSVTLREPGHETGAMLKRDAEGLR